jgi:hypothetical protein
MLAFLNVSGHVCNDMLHVEGDCFEFIGRSYKPASIDRAESRPHADKTNARAFG